MRSNMISFKGILIFMLVFMLFAVSFGPAGCSSNGSDDDTAAPESLSLDLPAVYSTATSLAVDVAYEPDAVPYTGSASNGLMSWSLLESNIQALFQGRSIVPDIIVPKDISEMERIPEQNRASWSGSDILDLAGRTWPDVSRPGEAEFHVIFLSGYFIEDGKENRQVIGVAFIGTSIIAIFKSVILGSGNASVVARYIEQATLIHEFGHAMGLVNNGIPMVSPHEDSGHEHHCTNSNCVMFWQNEGGNDLKLFAQQMIDTGSQVMFGPECLTDTQSYIP